MQLHKSNSLGSVTDDGQTFQMILTFLFSQTGCKVYNVNQANNAELISWDIWSHIPSYLIYLEAKEAKKWKQWGWSDQLGQQQQQQQQQQQDFMTFFAIWPFASTQFWIPH